MWLIEIPFIKQWSCVLCENARKILIFFPCERKRNYHQEDCLSHRYKVSDIHSAKTFTLDAIRKNRCDGKTIMFCFLQLMIVV